MNKKSVHFTGLIKLKEEYIERYIILHKYTFPGVLKRIAHSNIFNYSIFLHENLLFSHYEYRGKNYRKDIESIADEVTREWWKLTDPMQEPLSSRKENEWWASADNLLIFENPVQPRSKYLRKVFMIKLKPKVTIKYDWDSKSFVTVKGLHKILICHKDNTLYAFIENTRESNVTCIKTLIDFLNREVLDQAISDSDLIPMSEIFYTDLKKEDQTRKVFVTGCFDMLHSGHIAFLQEAAMYGDLYVSIGSDENVNILKGRYPINNQEERVYMLKSLKYVNDCYVNSGFGIMDFLHELNRVKPDVFIVNEDGNSPSKAALCSKMGIDYKVLKRIPHKNLPRRSTTELRKECVIPYRIDIAGGWLDQPFVSKFFPGPVITISIEPTIEFNDRSGMASSTRRKALELWKTNIPQGDPEQLAKILFTFDNPPGTKNVSGSQDALGIVLPGLNKLNYKSEYWPVSINSLHDEETLTWLENSLYLITLGPRHNTYSVVDNTSISRDGAKSLSDAAEGCWDAIVKKDINNFGKCVRESFESQIAMFPNMVNKDIMKTISLYKDKVKGWKLSGAGGGGYLIFVNDKPLEGAIKIKIRRQNRYA